MTSDLFLVDLFHDDPILSRDGNDEDDDDDHDDDDDGDGCGNDNHDNHDDNGGGGGDDDEDDGSGDDDYDDDHDDEDGDGGGCNIDNGGGGDDNRGSDDYDNDEDDDVDNDDDADSRESKDDDNNGVNIDDDEDKSTNDNNTNFIKFKTSCTNRPGPTSGVWWRDNRTADVGQAWPGNLSLVVVLVRNLARFFHCTLTSGAARSWIPMPQAAAIFVLSDCRSVGVGNAHRILTTAKGRVRSRDKLDKSKTN
ncbi:replicase polyprotein 1a [Elysia marginata]|uniref:Replicase polyprotein 1a n=1 Tax=Elysia marginata TaxID=1093978 RepID=A0AAV4F1E4_9GAST|nr:replicase polyprotein 1a [Elysia marginata]